MGTTAKVRLCPELPGVFYWLYRAILCLTIAPLIGALVGLVAVFAGIFLGELAALAVLMLFMADIFLRMVRARRMRADEDRSLRNWDPEFDNLG